MKRFITVFLILFSAWWLFHPIAHAKKTRHESTGQIIVYAKAKDSSILSLRKGKRLVVPILKILEGKKKLSVGKLVKQYQRKIKAKQTIMLKLHIDNKNKDVETVELTNLSNLGKEYLRLEVKYSNKFLKNHRDKILIRSIEFD